eukprot:TRINITY_DN4950_c0_g1_i1.p1 TRINITY_DN4950_c0_g1~~TRINITY_DN4950_c0_g1_i1.p1  ORF type:complete len:210 (+),score=54.31 TRINITY_DN4950_c0_g1_i1:169-798(+)
MPLSTPGPGSYDPKENFTGSTERAKKVPRLRKATLYPSYTKMVQKSNKSVGPGAYNPELEAVRSKAKTMIIYQSPKEDRKQITDKMYKFISEIRPVNRSDEYDMVSYAECVQRKNNAIMWRKPRKKENREEFSSPGPGSYNAIDYAAQNQRQIVFGTQERTVGVLSKNNNFLIKTRNDEALPEVGSYFKKTYFKWKTDPYPSTFFYYTN